MLSVASLEVETQSHDSATSSPPLNQEAHIFTSKFPPIPISNNRPLHAYCFENISNVADKTCLIVANSGKTYSYSETHLISKRVAVGLTRLGIGKGDVVMVLLQNSAEFVFTFMGASMIGAATTMANPFCTAKEILKQFKLSGAKMIVTQSIYVDKLKEGREEEFDFTVVTVDGDREGCIHFSELSGADEGAFCEIEIEIDANEAVAIPFSSGTTGLPKGVILTHKSLITNVAQQVDGENPNLYLQQNDVALCVLPLFHIFALNSVLLCALRRGASVLLVPKFEIQSFLDLMQRYRVTVAAVVPPLVLALTKNPIVDSYDLSAVRMVHSGAAPLGKDLEAALLRRLPQVVFGQGYGMTEAGPVLTMCPAFAKKPLSTKSGSCGAVIRNAELMVIDPKTGCSLPRNQPGELCIRGSQLMKGYLNDPKATARTIDVDGWLHTGDIGYVDDDDDVFIVDRAKELIKFKGFQVPPAELEALLISHPEINDAAVVPQKDEAAGEVPVAFVVQNGFQLTEEAVKDFISKQVVFYKRLHKVYFVHAIPKSPSGKILRKELRAKLASAS